MITAPPGWTIRKLADVCFAISKIDPTETGRPTVRYVDISSVTGQRIQGPPTVNSAEAPGRCRQVMKAGDALFSTVRPYLMKIALVGENLSGEFASTGFSVLRVDRQVVDHRYLHYFALSSHLLGQVLPMQRGVSYPAVTDRQVRQTSIWFPCLEQQRRIVDILEDHLSRLDAANDLLHRSTRRLVNLRQSTLSAVVDGPGRRRIPLADLVVRVETGRSFGGAASPATPGEWGIIKVSAMTWGSFRPEENKAVRLDQANRRYEIHEGDLLISRANTSTYVGASVLVGPTRPQLLLSDKSLRLIPRPGIDVRWLQLALSTPRTRSQISAAATGTKDSMRNISQTALLRTELPDRTSEQQRRDVRAVLERLASAEALEQSVNLVQQRAKVQRRSLLASAFDGRLTGSSTAEAIGDDLAGSGDGDRRRRPSRSSTRWNCANGSG